MSEHGPEHLCTIFLYSLKAEQSGVFTAFKIQISDFDLTSKIN